VVAVTIMIASDKTGSEFHHKGKSRSLQDKWDDGFSAFGVCYPKLLFVVSVLFKGP
jgi:hypothetical protein